MSDALSEVVQESFRYLAVDDLNKKQTARIAAELSDRYDEPWRKYHDATHLSTMVSFLLEHADELEDPSAVLWATLGHDSVYYPELYIPAPGVTPGANERRSEELTRGLLTPYLDPKRISSISGHILNTIGHKPLTPHTTSDNHYFLDADIVVLGGNPETFEAYDTGVAQEFGFVDSEKYRVERAGVLSKFLAQETIFLTSAAQALYETQAEINLSRKIAELQSPIA